MEKVSPSPRLRAQAYLALSQEEKEEFSKLPPERQVAILCVPNKQKNRFYHPKSDLLTVAIEYANFKLNQPEAKITEWEKSIRKMILLLLIQYVC